jgi:hypothetical protein
LFIHAQSHSIIVASTTSTEQSGHFGFLLPRFSDELLTAGQRQRYVNCADTIEGRLSCD